MRFASIVAALSWCVTCPNTSFAVETTASFSRYEDEGSTFCSVDFKNTDNTRLEVIDYWNEHGPQLMALVSQDGAPWMKIVDIESARLEISLIFSDGFRLVSSAFIDEYSGRPFINITPDMFFRLLTKPSWSVRVNDDTVLTFEGPSASKLEDDFLKCVNDWNLKD